MPPFQFHGGERHGAALLESALALPRQTFDGRYLYKTWHEKAGVLLRSLIKNHSLVDGNKRIGVATTFVFLLMNGRLWFAPNQEIVRFAVALAASEPDMPWREVARWIRSYTYKISHVKMLLSVVKARHPERASDVDEVATWVEEFWEWAQEGRAIDRKVRRACRRQGIDIDEFCRSA